MRAPTFNPPRAPTRWPCALATLATLADAAGVLVALAIFLVLSGLAGAMLAALSQRPT